MSFILHGLMYIYLPTKFQDILYISQLVSHGYTQNKKLSAFLVKLKFQNVCKLIKKKGSRELNIFTVSQFNKIFANTKNLFLL